MCDVLYDLSQNYSAKSSSRVTDLPVGKEVK